MGCSGLPNKDITQHSRNDIEDIFNKYHKTMLAAAYRILGNHDNAEDAVQDAFVRIIKYADKVTRISGDDLRAFVIIITKNCARRLYGKIQKQATGCVDDIKDNLISANNTEDIVLSSLSLSPMYHLICKLGDTYRDVVILKYYYDLLDKDIAKLLNISEANIRVRLLRARNTLRTMYEKERTLNEQS